MSGLQSSAVGGGAPGKKGRREWYAQRLSAEDSIELLAQMSLLAERGLPLPGGLRALAEEQPNGRLRRSLRALAGQLELGRTFAEALEHEDVRLPAAERALLVAAVKSGHFAEVVEQYLHGRMQAQDMYRRLRNLLTYPILMSVACVVMMVLLENMVVSSFRDVFKDFDADLPAATEALLMVSSGVAYFFAGAIAAVLAVGLLLLLGTGAAFRRRAAYRVPVLGRLWRFAVLSQFARMASLLVRHAVPLPDALALAVSATGDPELRRSIGQVVQQLLAGKSLGAQLTAEANLPAGFAQTVIWGEDRNALADSLALAGEMFEARAQTQYGLAGLIGPPFALAFVIAIFGFVVISLMLPLIGLLEKLA